MQTRALNSMWRAYLYEAGHSSPEFIVGDALHTFGTAGDVHEDGSGHKIDKDRAEEAAWSTQR